MSAAATAPDGALRLSRMLQFGDSMFPVGAFAFSGGLESAVQKGVVHDLGTLEAFTRDAQAQGFDEVLERKWAPLTVLEQHTHPFALWARVVAGEMWLTIGEDVRHLLPGDEFSLQREVPHAERYGKDGATYWVARRHQEA